MTKRAGVTRRTMVTRRTGVTRRAVVTRCTRVTRRAGVTKCIGVTKRAGLTIRAERAAAASSVRFPVKYQSYLVTLKWISVQKANYVFCFCFEHRFWEKGRLGLEVGGGERERERENKQTKINTQQCHSASSGRIDLDSADEVFS